jgi:flagellar export protein FliJ
MADLDPLVRLKQFELDEKQRRIAAMYAEIEQLEYRKSNLLEQVEHEKKIAEELGSIESIQSLTYFMYKVRENIDQLNSAIKKVEERIDIARIDMQDSFAELKKVEITQHKRLEQIAAENKRKEDDFFNDVALQTYRRRLEEDDH